MAEYIKREALIDAVESIDWYSVYKGKLTAGAPNTENALYKASSIYAVIDNAPAADVVPVRHGRWIEPSRLYYGAKQYECSLCCSDTFWKKHSITEKYPHCPNCGAKMDGGDGNSDIA